jgi:hypothetical protein
MTWAVAERWSWHGQQGAWLVRNLAGTPMRQGHARKGRMEYEARRPDAAQIVYRRSAPRRRVSTVGQAIQRAADLNVCATFPRGGWGSNAIDAERQRAYYVELGQAIPNRSIERPTAPPADPDRITLAEEGGETLRLEIAPLTVTASPEQKLGIWQWRNEWWHDEATGWKGTWATYETTGSIYVVRVRLMDEWPLLEPSEFLRTLWDALEGKRRPTLRDQEAISARLSTTPIGPVEDLHHTVDAQLRSLVSGE